MIDYDKIARYQEIERRGLLYRLPADKQARWAEVKRRGLDKIPDNYDAADKLKYTLRAAGEGMTFGLGDVVAGASNTLIAPLAKTIAALTEGTALHASDFNPLKNFKEGRGDFVREQQAFAKEHPGLNMAGEIGGGLATALLGGAAASAAKAATKGAGWGTRLFKTAAVGAKEGAKWGGLYGGGTGLTHDADQLNLTDGFRGAVAGAAPGAMLGSAFGVGGFATRGAGKLIRKGVNAYKNRTYNALSKAAGEDAINQAISEGRALLDSANEPMMRLAERTKLNEPKAAQIYRDYTDKRLGQQRSILEHTIDDHFGNLGYSQRLEKMNLARQAEDGPLYQKAIYGQDGKGVRLDELPLTLDELDYIERVYKTTGMKNATRGLPYNHMRVLDYAKQLMDSEISRAVRNEDGTRVANLMSLKNGFLDKVDARNPLYKQARSVFERYKKLEDAMAQGKRLHTGSTSERRFDLDGMSRQEQQYYTYGAREKLLENFNNFKSGKGNLPKKVFDQNTLQRLKLLPIDYPKLQQTVQREARAAENANRLMGGSQTAERHASMGRAALGPKRTIRRWLADQIDRYTEPNAQEVARMMTDPKYLNAQRYEAMKRDLDVARRVGRAHFNLLRAGGPLIKKGEEPAKINKPTWDHFKQSPDWRTYNDIQYIRDIHSQGRPLKGIPNYKQRNDFSSWDYYKKEIQTPEGKKEKLITIGNGKKGRQLHSLNPDVKEWEAKIKSGEKKTRFPLAINPWGVTGLQKENSLRNELSLLNSIGKNKRIVKPLRFSDFVKTLMSPQAGGLSASALSSNELADTHGAAFARALNEILARPYTRALQKQREEK